MKALELVEEEYIRRLDHIKVACIGPITADTAKKLGISVHCIADTYTIEGLLETIQKI